MVTTPEPTSFLELDTWLAHHFDVKDGWPMAFCETGDEYISFRCSTKNQNRLKDVAPPLNAKSLCEEALVGAVRKYAFVGPGTVFWRMRPELVGEENGHFSAACRLYVSRNLFWSVENRWLAAVVRK